MVNGYNYDTKLEIFTNNQDCKSPTSTGNYNDDGQVCSDWDNSQETGTPYTPSELYGVTLQPGQYYIVVDGYGGAQVIICLQLVWPVGVTLHLPILSKQHG